MALLSNLQGNITNAQSFETAALMTHVASENDIDELGHVNNAVYLIWAQEIATAHWRALASDGLQKSFVWVALRHEIDYRDQVLAGDMVEIRTWLGRAAGPRYARHVDIRKPGSSRFSACVLTDWCLVDAESRKPKRVGAEIFSLFGLPSN